jgi:hypothetical protein
MFVRDLIIIAVILLVIHLIGGAHSHRRARRRGLRPSLFYTYGMGWYGSIHLLGGFRLGHRITAGFVLTVVVIVAVAVLVIRARLSHYA